MILQGPNANSHENRLYWSRSCSLQKKEHILPPIKALNVLKGEMKEE